MDILKVKNMSDLVVHPTSIAQWHALVSEAESASGCILKEDLESYLVFLLMRFANQPHMLARVLAMDYLNGLSAGDRQRREMLKEVGDHCLLFSGLFPQQAERRMVKVSYFVDLGRVAYSQTAELTDDLMAAVYSDLAREFVSLMDILQTMRTLQGKASKLTPLNAFELWRETGSQHAYQVIRAVSDGHPVHTAGDEPGAGDDNSKLH